MTNRHICQALIWHNVIGWWYAKSVKRIAKEQRIYANFSANANRDWTSTSVQVWKRGTHTAHGNAAAFGRFLQCQHRLYSYANRQTGYQPIKPRHSRLIQPYAMSEFLLYMQKSQPVWLRFLQQKRRGKMKKIRKKILEPLLTWSFVYIIPCKCEEKKCRIIKFLWSYVTRLIPGTSGRYLSI